jgi:hypothetical protein
MLGECPTGGRGRDRTGRTVEKLAVQVRFEALDATGEGRLRDSEGGRRHPQMPVVDHREKPAQVLDLHSYLRC